jgi:hypothetical protein
MNDPEGDSDTEPTGHPVASAEDTDRGGAEMMETNDKFPEELEAQPSEHDTEDFWRWLPTMWLGHRRGKELVQRASSDGADFAAYAGAGRPARASVPLRPEATVQVRTAPSTGSGAALVHGEVTHSSEALERDAPTVLKRRRIVGPGGVLVGWGAVGLVAVSASIGGWAHRPAAKETAGKSGAAAPSVPIASRVAKEREPLEATSLAPPSPAGLPGGAQAANTNTPKTPVGERAAPSTPSMKEPRHKADVAGAAAAGVDSPPKRRSPPLPAASAVPAKAQYFEAQ